MKLEFKGGIILDFIKKYKNFILGVIIGVVIIKVIEILSNMSSYEQYSILGQWISGIGLIIVSYFACKIAKEQILLTKQNVKISLYEKRLRMFNILSDILLENLTRGNIDKNSKSTLEKIVDIKDEITFLFQKDIEEYLVQIINNLSKYNEYLINNDTKNKNFYILQDWFIKEIENKIIRNKFNKYLNLGNYGLI